VAMRGLIRRITVAVGAVVVLLGPAVGAAASVNAVPAAFSSGPMPGWSIVQTQNSLARTGQLAGVSCPSSSSCTAVGNFIRGSGVAVTLAEHWDGRRWAIQATPSPRKAKLSLLFGVSCSSPSACTAVGQAVSNQGASTPLAERWNGTQWRIQATPNPPVGNGALFGVACTSSSACTAVGSSNSGTLAEHWNGTRWRIQATPSPSAGGGFLASVACVSASACTAVGSSNSGTLAEHWNGTAWRIQRTPNPSGAQFSFLNAVSCTSASACTAAGGYGNNSSPPQVLPLAERWDGTRWHIQRTPNPSGAQFSFLNAVSCTSASACITVGNAATSLNTPLTLAEHWNGTRWGIQSTPNRAGAAASALVSVACTSPRSCMAVGGARSLSGIGGYLAERWNGTRWSLLRTPALPPGALSIVSCTSPSACTAVGQKTNRAGIVVPLAERWNGTAWRVQPTPSGAAGRVFGGVSCPTGSFCMATGGPGQPRPLAERWNGKTWRILPIPAPGGAQLVLLGPVSCTSPAACTATGVAVDRSGIGRTLAERWNGTAWRIQPTPNPPGAQGAALDGGVACTGPSACTAVGARYDSAGNPVATLAERWDGVTWHIVPSPSPAGGGELRAVSCAAPSACTAVGTSNSGTTLAERWNGTRWRIQPTPNPAAGFQIALDGVACPARRFCTAVGDYGVNGTGLTLGLQWRGTGQSPQISPALAHPGAGCGALPATPDRLPWDFSDAGRTLTGPSLGSRALTQGGLIAGRREWHC